MATRAEELKARAAELKRRKQAAEKRTSEAKPVAGGDASLKPRQHPSPATPVTHPIRSTVDLPPVRHQALKVWCGETAVEIGRTRVTTQDVLRTLVARLLTDETLARKIRDDLRREIQ